jgi:UDP-N-acetylmuramoyl-L-alanyl-D-glutamate--2,6-diaminopimelate ligase
MKLKKLLSEIPDLLLKGPKETEITGVASNSKLVSPGNLFVARRGDAYDGVAFIPEAISAGAKAILTDIYDPAYRSISQIICEDVRKAEAQLAASFYGYPSEQLFLVGITGTSGKTTVSHLVKHLLDHFKGPSGLIGTIQYQVGNVSYPASHTTPDVVRCHKMLREMVDHGLRSAVLEVTSHALDQGRVDLLEFDYGIFTNLSQEHLDYHKDMEAYAACKRMLFTKLAQGNKREKVAITNADSPWSVPLIKGLQLPTMTYGMEASADLRANNLQLDPKGSCFNVCFQGRENEAKISLPGKFNVYNALAAISVCLCNQIPLDEILEVLRRVPPVPGRMDKVPNDKGIHVFVDYAHKPDALAKVLECLKEMPHRKLITVFGCGGDRDRNKRPMMAAICEHYSDITVITSDNPRSEDPQAIIREIIQGFESNNYRVEVDRKKAIWSALDEAREGDIVLIAGKGHEKTQIFAQQTIVFDDKEIVREYDSILRGK